MLDREQRLRLNTKFCEKAIISDKVEHNKKDIDHQKRMWMAEPSEKTALARKAHIRRCERAISAQKTELMSMSATKIARETEIPVNQVRYQEMLFNRARIVL